MMFFQSALQEVLLTELKGLNFISNEISAASTTVNTSLPGTDETFFGLRMNITGSPVKFEKSNYKQNMITQMIQPVERKYDVLLERSSGSFQNRAKGV